MKILFVMALVVFQSARAFGSESTPSRDLSWSDLREASGDGLELALRQSITMSSATRSMTFATGAVFELENEIPLDGISVVLFEMRAKNCTDPSAEQSDVDLILPDGSDTGRDRRVGVTLQAGCLLSFFAETTDYMSVSVFSSR